MGSYSYLLLAFWGLAMKWFFSQSLSGMPGCLVEFGIKYLIVTIIPGLFFSFFVPVDAGTPRCSRGFYKNILSMELAGRQVPAGSLFLQHANQAVNFLL